MAAENRVLEFRAVVVLGMDRAADAASDSGNPLRDISTIVVDEIMGHLESLQYVDDVTIETLSHDGKEIRRPMRKAARDGRYFRGRIVVRRATGSRLPSPPDSGVCSTASWTGPRGQRALELRERVPPGRCR
jgi:hypothetical protein